MKIFTFALALCLGSFVSALTAAPASIANSLASFQEIAGSNFTASLTLFRPDGTFQDISLDYKFAGQPVVSGTPRSGTYTYGPSSATPGHYTLVLTDAATQQVYPADLAFGSETGGTFNNSSMATFHFYLALADLPGAVNVSSRSRVNAAHPAIPGFVLAGTHARWVLLRAIGPTLSQYQVAHPVATPRLEVFSGTTSLGAYTSWTADPNRVPGMAAIFSLVGAFSLPANSADAAALVLLPPGAYTAHCSSTGADGELLAEVYLLPFGN